jgi:kynurenine formamidase
MIWIVCLGQVNSSSFYNALEHKRELYGEIIRNLIEKAEKDIVETKRIILDTGWYKYYGRPGKPDFYTEFPELSKEAARWLVDKGIKLFCTDISTPSLSENKEVHHILFKKKQYLFDQLKSVVTARGGGRWIDEILKARTETQQEAVISAYLEWKKMQDASQQAPKR